MKKLLRLLWLVLLALGLVIVIAVLAVGLFANRALKVAVESAGARALNVGVSVGGADFGTGAGKGIGEGVMKGAADIGKGISEGMKALLGQKKKED